MWNISLKAVPARKALPYLSVDESYTLAQEYVSAVLTTNPYELSAELHAEFVTVFRFKELTSRESYYDGWIIGGGIPHLFLSICELINPIEALAIYCLLGTIFFGKYDVNEVGKSLPDYRMPPGWEVINGRDNQIAAFTNTAQTIIVYQIIIPNSDQIQSEEVRRRCMRAGWVRQE